MVSEYGLYVNGPVPQDVLELLGHVVSLHSSRGWYLRLTGLAFDDLIQTLVEGGLYRHYPSLSSYRRPPGWCYGAVERTLPWDQWARLSGEGRRSYARMVQLILGVNGQSPCRYLLLYPTKPSLLMEFAALLCQQRSIKVLNMQQEADVEAVHASLKRRGIQWRQVNQWRSRKGIPLKPEGEEEEEHKGEGISFREEPYEPEAQTRPAIRFADFCVVCGVPCYGERCEICLKEGVPV